MFLTDTQKIGAGLTGFGVLFMLIGVLTFFDAGLLAIGNILFLAGLTFVIGPMNTFLFFFQWHKAKGTACFLGGIVLVFLKWPLIGMGVELFGFINLFGDFFPVVIAFLRRIPFVSTVLEFPGIREIANKLGGKPLPV